MRRSGSAARNRTLSFSNAAGNSSASRAQQVIFEICLPGVHGLRLGNSAASALANVGLAHVERLECRRAYQLQIFVPIEVRGERLNSLRVMMWYVLLGSRIATRSIESLRQQRFRNRAPAWPSSRRPPAYRRPVGTCSPCAPRSAGVSPPISRRSSDSTSGRAGKGRPGGRWRWSWWNPSRRAAPKANSGGDAHAMQARHLLHHVRLLFSAVIRASSGSIGLRPFFSMAAVSMHAAYASPDLLLDFAAIRLSWPRRPES